MTMRGAVYALLAATWLLPLLTHPFDCPFGLHDWGYPCFDEQRAHLAAAWLGPWNEAGLGGLQARPAIEPPYVVLTVAQMLSPALGLRLVLFACALLGALAADVAAARVFGAASPFARFAAGVVYLASPFFANKLAAGHIGFLFAMPLVPALAIASERLVEVGAGAPTRAFAAAAASLAAMFAQLQVGLLAIAVLAAAYSRRISTERIAGIAVLALVTWAPAAYMGLMGASEGAFVRESQLHAWFVDQSIPWQHALDATWYFPHYFERFAGSWSVALWQWLSLAAILTALVVRGAPRRLAAACVVLAAIAAGTHGPLASIVASAFAALPGAAVFRELYDLLFLAPLVVAGGAAVAIDGALARSATSGVLRAGAVVGASALVVACVTPVLAGAVARHVPLVASAAFEPLARRAAALPDGGRVLWLPSAVPVGPRGSTAGADTFGAWFGEHPVADVYHPSGYVAYVSAYADRRLALPPFARAATDIQAVIARPDVVSRRLSGPAHPAGRDVGPSPARFVVYPSHARFALFESEPACEPALRDAMRPGFAYIRCDERDAPFEFREDQASVADDPARDWLDADRWAELDPQLAAPRTPTLFTTSGAPYQWLNAAPMRLLIYAPKGGVLDGRPLRPAARWQPAGVPAGMQAIRALRGALIAVTADRVSALPHGGGSGEVSSAREIAPALAWRTLGAYRLVLPPHARGLLMLREAWSPSWRAWLDGSELGSPLVADGYASAWLVAPTDRESTVVVRFVPTYAYVWLCLLAALVWAGLAVALVRRPRRPRTEA